MARLLGIRDENPTARTLVLAVPGWPGHLPGQHVDVRLTAPDGYTAERAYSLAAPADGERIELTVQRVEDGEVSDYLVGVFAVGDEIDVRGPVGGWFVWHPADPAPVSLVAGGSGIVPLMAMVRARHEGGMVRARREGGMVRARHESGMVRARREGGMVRARHEGGMVRAPFRLIHSVRSPADRYYADELARLGRIDDGIEIRHVYTRSVPDQCSRMPGRITISDVRESTWPPALAPACFVCGPTPFVENVATMLVDIGHDPARIRTERFGPTAPGAVSSTAPPRPEAARSSATSPQAAAAVPPTESEPATTKE